MWLKNVSFKIWVSEETNLGLKGWDVIKEPPGALVLSFQWVEILQVDLKFSSGPWLFYCLDWLAVEIVQIDLALWWLACGLWSPLQPYFHTKKLMLCNAAANCLHIFLHIITVPILCPCPDNNPTTMIFCAFTESASATHANSTKREMANAVLRWWSAVAGFLTRNQTLGHT